MARVAPSTKGIAQNMKAGARLGQRRKLSTPPVYFIAPEPTAEPLPPEVLEAHAVATTEPLRRCAATESYILAQISRAVRFNLIEVVIAVPGGTLIAFGLSSQKLAASFALALMQGAGVLEALHREALAKSGDYPGGDCQRAQMNIAASYASAGREQREIARHLMMRSKTIAEERERDAKRQAAADREAQIETLRRRDAEARAAVQQAETEELRQIESEAVAIMAGLPVEAQRELHGSRAGRMLVAEIDQRNVTGANGWLASVKAKAVQLTTQLEIDVLTAVLSGPAAKALKRSPEWKALNGAATDEDTAGMGAALEAVRRLVAELALATERGATPPGDAPADVAVPQVKEIEEEPDMRPVPPAPGVIVVGNYKMNFGPKPQVPKPVEPEPKPDNRPFPSVAFVRGAGLADMQRLPGFGQLDACGHDQLRRLAADGDIPKLSAALRRLRGK